MGLWSDRIQEKHMENISKANFAEILQINAIADSYALLRIRMLLTKEWVRVLYAANMRLFRYVTGYKSMDHERNATIQKNRE
jgi:hypothetical protein